MLKSKPKIEFLDRQNTIRFEGIFIIKSLWEEDEKLVEKIKDFISDRDKVKFDFALFYLDSVSRKIFFEMLIALKEDLYKVNDLTIIWQYEEEDESILELGDILSKILAIDFTFVKKE